MRQLPLSVPFFLAVYFRPPSVLSNQFPVFLIRHHVLGADPCNAAVDLYLDIGSQNGHFLDLCEVLLQRVLESLEVGETGRGNGIENDSIISVELPQVVKVFVLPRLDMLAVLVEEYLSGIVSHDSKTSILADNAVRHSPGAVWTLLQGLVTSL